MRWGCGLGRGGCWWLGANGAPHCYGYAGAQATYRLGVRRHPIRSPSPRARPSPGMGAKRARPTLCSSEPPLPGFCRGNPPKLVGGLPTACRKSCASLLFSFLLSTDILSLPLFGLCSTLCFVSISLPQLCSVPSPIWTFCYDNGTRSLPAPLRHAHGILASDLLPTPPACHPSVHTLSGRFSIIHNGPHGLSAAAPSRLLIQLHETKAEPIGGTSQTAHTTGQAAQDPFQPPSPNQLPRPPVPGDSSPHIRRT